MKLDGLCDDETAAALSFDWLNEVLQPVSEFGRAQFAELAPFRKGDEAAAALRARNLSAIAGSTDAALLEDVREALRELPDVGTTIARARLDDVLSDADLLEMLRFCDACERIATLVAGTPLTGPQPCEPLLRALEPGRPGKFGFYLADAFDDLLANRRGELRAAQAEFDTMRGRLSERVARALNRQDIATDEFIVMREDVRGALPAGVHVVREAPTYFLCELELDEAALAALRRRDQCAEAVAGTEEAVRARLGGTIKDFSGALEESAALAGALDVLLAAARFAQRHQCFAATYASQPTVEFVEARFLPLERELSHDGRAYVPITMQLFGSNVLTGPNMGGKTVALRTCGFIALCAAFGLPVPARSASVALFESISWLGIGFAHGGDDPLSSFGREIVRLRTTLEEDAHSALLLIDEFGRTTTPGEGRALLLALIARLQTREVCAVIATHLPRIANDAAVPHFAVRGLHGTGAQAEVQDIKEALRALASRMDYRIERVTDAGDRASDAIELAGLLGLDKELIENAKQILSQWTR